MSGSLVDAPAWQRHCMHGAPAELWHLVPDGAGDTDAVQHRRSDAADADFLLLALLPLALLLPMLPLRLRVGCACHPDLLSCCLEHQLSHACRAFACLMSAFDAHRSSMGHVPCTRNAACWVSGACTLSRRGQAAC